MPDDVLLLPDGRRLQHWVGGADGGPVVVVLHGCPDTRYVATGGDDAARRAGVRLVALNRPGYGRSDPAPTTHGSVGDDVADALEALGHRRFAVLGMSVGGQYALACAARHPGRVTAVGAVATPAVVPRLDPPCHRDDLSPEQRASVRALAQVPVDEAVERARPDFAAYVARLHLDDPDDDALVRRWAATLPAADAELLLRARPVAALAAAVREAHDPPDGYLRDAALAFREWDVRVEEVGCPVVLWYGDPRRQRPAAATAAGWPTTCRVRGSSSASGRRTSPRWSPTGTRSSPPCATCQPSADTRGGTARATSLRTPRHLLAARKRCSSSLRAMPTPLTETASLGASPRCGRALVVDGHIVHRYVATQRVVGGAA